VKNTKQNSVQNPEKEEIKKISPAEFDAVMKKILSAPPQPKTKKETKAGT